MKTMHDRVIARMQELELNPTSLARKMGKRQSTINSFISGRYKTFRDVSALADALQTTEQWLLKGTDQDKKSIRNSEYLLQSQVAKSMGDIPFGPDVVPVLGNANGSSEAIMLNVDEPIGELPRHPNQFNMKGAFAVYARGESMYPRYKSGDPVYAIANRPPARGQDCLVEMTNGEGFLKEFIKQTEEYIICEQFNPPGEWKRKLSDIHAIHAIVGRG
jgi:phage repressor protein C with HTH and peptisase S24 domain